jgi:hypothetical protein
VGCASLCPGWNGAVSELRASVKRANRVIPTYAPGDINAVQNSAVPNWHSFRRKHGARRVQMARGRVFFARTRRRPTSFQRASRICERLRPPTCLWCGRLASHAPRRRRRFNLAMVGCFRRRMPDHSSIRTKPRMVLAAWPVGGLRR